MLGRIGSFFSESKQELAKVAWPSRNEIMGATTLVIVVTLIVAAFIFVADILLSFLMRVIIR